MQDRREAGERGRHVREDAERAAERRDDARPGAYRNTYAHRVAVATDVELAIDAVRAGMDVVRARSGERLERVAKGADDFATEADLGAERAIRSVLGDAGPGDAVVGEELGGSGDAGARVWLVDPLCGTRNFASGAGEYCTNVALRVDGVLTVAAVGDPRRDRICWTDGHVAGVRCDGRDAPLRPGARNRIVELNADEPWDRLGSALLADRTFREWMTPRVSATTLVLAWVAAGNRAAYVNEGDLRGNVHFAAGIALCRGAGCVVTDLAGDHPDSGRGLLVAADRDVHRELRRRIDALRPH